MPSSAMMFGEQAAGRSRADGRFRSVQRPDAVVDAVRWSRRARPDQVPAWLGDFLGAAGRRAAPLEDGDWILRDGHGHVCALPPGRFARMFEPLAER
jgi:hypothetical protein